MILMEAMCFLSLCPHFLLTLSTGPGLEIFNGKIQKQLNNKNYWAIQEATDRIKQT